MLSFRASLALALSAFLPCAALAAVVTAIPGCARKKRPNVIVVLVDTLRADHLGCYGFPADISPSVDRLAAESVVFERCVSPAPWTKPSVATLFTSLYPSQHGLSSSPKSMPDPSQARDTEVLPAAIETMAESFSGAGYETAAFVTNHWLQDPYGFSQGFDRYIFRPRKYEPAPGIVAIAKEWLAGRKSARPFFLYLHLMDVHGPYHFSEEDLTMMKSVLGPKDRPLSARETKSLHFYMGATWRGRPAMAGSLLNWRAAYAAGVRRCDRAIGDFLDTVRRQGLLENTIIVLTADHGEGLMDHGRMEHGQSLHIEQLHVPLVIRLPGAAPEPRRVKGWVGLIDVLPTLADLCDLKAPRNAWVGKSLASALRGGSVRSRAMHSTAVKNPPFADSVIQGEFHLIEKVETKNRELYHLASDPKEARDASADHPRVVGSLAGKIAQHRNDFDRRGLDPSNVPMSEELKEQLRSLGYLQ